MMQVRAVSHICPVIKHLGMRYLYSDRFETTDYEDVEKFVTNRKYPMFELARALQDFTSTSIDSFFNYDSDAC